MNSSSNLPKLVVSKSLPKIHLDLPEVAKLFRSLGVSEDTIANTTIYIDSKPHARIMGSVWPPFLAKLRYPSLKPKGCVVRLSSRVWFWGSTGRSINHTLVHEGEHLAQIDRKDPSLVIGYLTNTAFLLAGIWLGLTSKAEPIIFQILIMLITASFGLKMGYMFSLHEIKARRVSTNYDVVDPFITFADKKSPNQQGS